MDIEKIEKKLKKINTVLAIFKEDGRLSKIEKDLLLGYVRDLYDSVCYVEEDVKSVNINELSIHEVKFEGNLSNLEENQISANPVIVDEKIVAHSFKSNIQEKIEEPTIYQDKIVSNIVNVEPVTSILKTEVDQPIINEVEPTPIKPTINTIKTHSHEIKIDDYPELAELFSDEEPTDISDKLSMKKIDQIATSLGINDRFFMINELFNGDGTLFSKTLEKLDGCESLEGAKKVVLNDVAIPMKWVENNKLIAAEDFIKLIKRKYK